MEAKRVAACSIIRSLTDSDVCCANSLITFLISTLVSGRRSLLDAVPLHRLMPFSTLGNKAAVSVGSE